MPTDDHRPLTGEKLVVYIRNPVGMPSIRELATNGRGAVVVFNDLSRDTLAGMLTQLVTEGLLAGGLGREHIRLLCALRNHAPSTKTGFVQKLGEELMKQFPVYNHSPYKNLVSVSTNHFGDEVLVNREFIRCDVHIGMGPVPPHPMNGLDEGEKPISPGLASVRTTYTDHSQRKFRPLSPEPYRLRRDTKVMTRMVIPLFKTDAVLNPRPEIVELRMGGRRREHRQTVAPSQALNGMCRAEGTRDVVFVDTNAECNEAFIVTHAVAMSLKSGDDTVLINYYPAGQMVHYLYSASDNDYDGGCWQLCDKRPRPEIGRITCYTPYPNVVSRMDLSEPNKVVFAKTWDQVMSLLGTRNPGVQASVISDGTTSYFQLF